MQVSDQKYSERFAKETKTGLAENEREKKKKNEEK